MAADRVTRGTFGQRHDAEIDVRRKPAIEAGFRQACGPAASRRREVEIGKAHRLLELVDPRAVHEDPGHVGLTRLKAVGNGAVALGSAQESDLADQGRDAVVRGILDQNFILALQHDNLLPNEQRYGLTLINDPGRRRNSLSEIQADLPICCFETETMPAASWPKPW
ncbi:hypothetical protein [Bradyrhizobium sp. USDA 328]|uniref:hypothetical protein n=1 Tax=Bradyrhizobium sp. USDA 328 TaxID=3156309 RepID=UPI003514F85F